MRLLAVVLGVLFGALVDDVLTAGSKIVFHAGVVDLVKVRFGSDDSLTQEGVALIGQRRADAFFGIDRAHVERSHNAAAVLGALESNLDVVRLDTGVVQRLRNGGILADVQSVDGDGMVNVHTGVHDVFARRGDGLVRAVLHAHMVHIFNAGL